MAFLYLGGFWHTSISICYYQCRIFLNLQLLYISVGFAMLVIVIIYLLQYYCRFLCIKQWKMDFFLVARMDNGLIVPDSYSSWYIETFTYMNYIENDMTQVEYINSLDRSLILYKYDKKIELRSNYFPSPPQKKKKLKLKNFGRVRKINQLKLDLLKG